MNTTEHLLVCLMEECAEVQQACAKSLRFGLDAVGSAGSNSDNIRQEIIDIIAIIELLEENNVLGGGVKGIHAKVSKKKEKVLCHMRDARERGALLWEL